MKKSFLLIIALWLISSCEFRPGGSRNNANPDKIFKLRVSPIAGANYDYKVLNETKTEFDVDEKTIENTNRTNYVVNYKINKDTSGNFEVGIQYTKIHIYQKKNGEESDMDADNASESSDPVERMLGALLHARITATIDPSGNVVGVNGYQEIANQYLSQINNTDLGTELQVQNQWKQLIEKNLVKQNMERLFKMFPDSTLHVGDKWKMAYKEDGDISFGFIYNYCSFLQKFICILFIDGKLAGRKFYFENINTTVTTIKQQINLKEYFIKNEWFTPTTSPIQPYQAICSSFAPEFV